MTWYLPTCPPWCDRTHGGILTPEDDPATFDSPDTQPWVCHTRPLAASAHGLALTLAQWEAHPNAEPVELAPVVILEPPNHHDAEGVPLDVLRAWSAVLDAAATEAENLTGGDQA